MNLICRQNWVSSFFMGMEGNFFLWVLYFIGMERNFFHWVGYIFGSLLNDFMEMNDFWVDWDIVRVL